MRYRKNTIGFRDTVTEDENEVLTAGEATVKEREPQVCVAKVMFRDANIPLDYYNDEFYLEPGDKVFVSGKFYGQIGVVQSVTTHFRIDRTKYKKVIGKPCLEISGNFVRVNDKMVSFDTNFDAERFGSVMIPPPDPEKERAEEIICGEGWNIDLMNFEESDSVDCSRLDGALECCKSGNVVYISIKDGRGAAFIKGKHLYKAEFGFDGETVSDFFCTCPFNDDCLCKHELAVLITLRMLLQFPELEEKTDFTAFDSDFFWKYVSSEVNGIELK